MQGVHKMVNGDIFASVLDCCEAMACTTLCCALLQAERWWLAQWRK
jgi:hypothetical protein